MNYNQTHEYTPETSTVAFPDWVGVPGSPYASDQAPLSLDDASGSVCAFEREIDDMLFDGMNQTHFLCQPSMTTDWEPAYVALPFAPTLDPFADDMSSTADTFNETLSPVSDSTLVSSPTASMLPELKLPPPEDALVDHQLASPPSLYPEFDFTFQCQPSATTPPLDMYTSITSMSQGNHDYQDYSQYSPEQLPSQHGVGVARVVVAGLMTGVEINTDSFTLISMGPASPCLSPPSAEHQQDTLVVSEEEKSIPATRTKRCRDVSEDNSAGNNDVPKKRKQRKQNTTKRFACPEPDCDSMFARTFNLKVHIRSVHLQERIHGCKAPGCKRAFSRKHDLDRHYQSAHTKLGSPRKTANQYGKTVKGRKSIKNLKDRHQ